MDKTSRRSRVSCQSRSLSPALIAPDYLIDGIFQRRFTSATAMTGVGKTALALLIARLVGGSE